MKKLYEALYQDSVDVELLKQIEENVYNVVKSDTITNLEVDIASLRYLTDRDSFLNAFFSTPVKDNNEEASTMVTFAEISDPNQLASQFSLTATELSEKVFDKENLHWSKAYELIDVVYEHTGVHLRESNNKYHVSMKKITRYSLKMVDLLKKVKDMKPYTIEIDGKQISYPIEDKDD